MRLSRREKGEGQFGCLVGMILLALAIFVAYKMIPIKVKNAELRQVIVDEAKSAGTHRDDRILAAILAKAQEDHLPITEQNVNIKRGQGEITVDVDYVMPVEFPGFTYQWSIHHHAQNPIF
jgi:hypothetical protein